MSAQDRAVARQFLDALAAAAKTGEFDEVYGFLAPDVEWATPLSADHGVVGVREGLVWYEPGKSLDLDFEERELTDLGDGRFALDFHQIYRTKQTGEPAHARERRIELAIHEGKVVRYEMQVAG